MENIEGTICPLCRNEKVKIFAVGECAHPVCHLCSTKMRVLCEQTYCAICRQDLPRVYFVSDLADTRSRIDQSRFTPIDETGDCGIYYPTKTDWIRREAENLLRNFCPFCHSEYETFEVLRDHVRRTHRYFYCDLCVENLNLFPHERKCYTRQELVQHIRQGDRDDQSFKGHPLCRFCDDHFLDVDQLYKHMRKEHYYCHLCSTDSVYYSGFDLLREHYRSSHYLCEIGQCKDVQFTNVFASEIDFRAHQAALHSKNRAEARQLGTIPMEFQSRTTRDRKQQQQDSAHRETFRGSEFNTQGNNSASRNDREETQQEPAIAFVVPSIDEFPTLGDRPSTPQQRGAWSNDPLRGIHSSIDYPALASVGSNVPNANAGQPRGIWREQQQQQQQQIVSSSSTSQNTAPKKASQPITNGTASVTKKEDFPALKTASNARVLAPVSVLSAWSTARKSAKSASATAKAYQPQTRMNTNRLAYDDEEDECLRRPMSALTTSTTPMAGSNITMISSSNLSSNPTNEKQKTNKNQSIPNARDFPALPSTTSTQSTAASSGVWTNNEANPSAKTSTTQNKKKNAGMSKKKFMEEVQTMRPPSGLLSTDDFPTIGLNELGRRLLVEEKKPTVNTQVKEDKPLLLSSSSVTATATSTTATKKPEKKEEKKVTSQPNKKTQTITNTNDLVQQEIPSIQNKSPVKPVTNQASSQSIKPNESVIPSVVAAALPPPPSPTTSSTEPPPGFTVPTPVAPPPGFNPVPSTQSILPSYTFLRSYSKQKDEFRAKLFDLFDGDMNLFVEYEQFCEAFSQKRIASAPFIEYTSKLFKDKLDEYLLDLIVIMPDIEQQNDLYAIWIKDIHPVSTLSTVPTTTKTSNWTKKGVNENDISICRICQQIMLESDTDEHNSHHTEFNTQFPSLPSAAVSLGRANGKKKK